MCVECLNVDIGGKWRPVTWPEDAAEIETLLDARAVETTRNWTPDETLADLADEDAEHSEGDL
jgi:hypothetical protein